MGTTAGMMANKQLAYEAFLIDVLEVTIPHFADISDLFADRFSQSHIIYRALTHLLSNFKS
jgi:hypothetical protein